MERLNIEGWLEQAPPRETLIIRDDQYDLPELQKIFYLSRKKKINIKLLDSGKLTSLELGTLTFTPFSFYTSDSVRKDFQELVLLTGILRAKHCYSYYFIQSELKSDSAIFNAPEIFKSVFITNREERQNPELLSRLSELAFRTGTAFVYYHHGNPEGTLAENGHKGVWIHLSDKSFGQQNEDLIVDLAREMKKKGGQLVVHVDRGQEYYFLKRLSDNSCFLIFNLPVEHSSKIYALESYWQRRKLPEGAFYLYPHIIA
ncbi:MAG: hypothetical protein ACPLZD_02620 [Candidatus Saccharicenans sp.]|nr:MAG: hypothetical protein C0168_04455 [Candidatus Aminicenantes bacterium]HEK85388.1 hypothetical protein [Candidatus Aminicenantes bacterium]